MKEEEKIKRLLGRIYDAKPRQEFKENLLRDTSQIIESRHKSVLSRFVPLSIAATIVAAISIVALFSLYNPQGNKTNVVNICQEKPWKDLPDSGIKLVLRTTEQPVSNEQHPHCFTHRVLRPTLKWAEYIVSGMITKTQGANVTLKIIDVFKGDPKLLKEGKVSGKAYSGGCLPGPRYSEKDNGKILFLCAGPLQGDGILYLGPLNLPDLIDGALVSKDSYSKSAEYLHDYIKHDIANRVLKGEFNQQLIEDLDLSIKKEKEAWDFFVKTVAAKPEILDGLTKNYIYCPFIEIEKRGCHDYNILDRIATFNKEDGKVIFTKLFDRFKHELADPEIAHLLESAFRKPFLASRGVPAVCETGWFNEFEEQVEEFLWRIQKEKHAV